MPNWCSNRVHISGSTTDVAAFMALIRGESGDENTFSFQAILPCPSELHNYNAPQTDKDLAERFVKEYGYTDWYHWQVYNWGTKWDTSDCYLDYADEESASWYFSTAWSPPEGIYNELSRRFPDLSISWFFDEPGMQIAGYLNNPINGG
jgi:hypothetical protein